MVLVNTQRAAAEQVASGEAAPAAIAVGIVLVSLAEELYTCKTRSGSTYEVRLVVSVCGCPMGRLYSTHIVVRL